MELIHRANSLSAQKDFKATSAAKVNAGRNQSIVERKDELRSTVGGVSRWHGRDRTTLGISELPALWIVSSIVLLEFFCSRSDIV